MLVKDGNSRYEQVGNDAAAGVQATGANLLHTIPAARPHPVAEEGGWHSRGNRVQNAAGGERDRQVREFRPCKVRPQPILRTRCRKTRIARHTHRASLSPGGTTRCRAS